MVLGGAAKAETLQIEPTVMDSVSWDDAVMQEEIFGPILPVLTFERFEEVYELLANKPKPLALYLFSEDRQRMQQVTERCRYGGGCINDTIIHLATSEMGFGGVGESGMGAYHGKVGFDAFSPTQRAWWRKRHGWTFPCATSRTGARCTIGCCICFCGEAQGNGEEKTGRRGVPGGLFWCIPGRPRVHAGHPGK